MASSPVLDLDRLVAPVSEETPSGVELRSDSEGAALFFRVKECRDSARNAERQLMHWYGEGDKPDPPDWRVVAETSERILTEKSKDLWVCAWFLEALVRLHGFPGLRDGFQLVRQICERYWDQIHPTPDEDGYVHTVSQLSGVFDGALSPPIDAVSITPGGSGDLRLSAMSYRDAFELEKLDSDERSQRIEKGAVTLDQFSKAAIPANTDFFRNLDEDIDAALQEFLLLIECLEARCGTDESGYSAAPPVSSVRDSLVNVRDLVRSIARDLLTPASSDESAEEGGNAEEGSEPVSGGQAAGTNFSKIKTREEAFRALTLVADYFRKTEPHSPISYALEQAVRWGHMPFPDLMNELIADDDVRREMFRRTGIRKEQDD